MIPRRSYSDQTLHLRLPFGQTLGLTLVILGLALAAGEVLSRTPVFQAHVVANRWGGRHRQFELQLGRLETVVARGGPIDCIFLGNSMAWLGFDPEAFGRAYRRETGQDIHCFNFGVDGMPTVSAGALVPVLIRDYQPRLLIYGTTAQDYAISEESEEATVLLRMPWLRYRRGQLTVQGWIHEHSHLFHYSETLGHLLRLEKRYLLLTRHYASLKSNYGFEPYTGVGTLVSLPPNPERSAGQVQYLFGLLSDYEMLPENVQGLEQVMSQNSPDVQVLIVEMPVSPTYMGFFDNGRQDYQLFIDQVEGVARSGMVPFWQTNQKALIPEEGYWDYTHLNTEGARIFSEWLGEQVGRAAMEGTLRVPVGAR